MHLADDDGNTTQAQFPYVVIFNPSGGFVTGGGWLTSPGGACQLMTACATATGKATFGFVAKYASGATVPTGSTEFQFEAGGLDFRGTSDDWLVIGGAKAQYKGSGAINGGGSYEFLLTAIDGDLAGGGGVDKLRVKIWDPATGTVVYDNQAGAGDTADPTTAIGGGDIVIHAP